MDFTPAPYGHTACCAKKKTSNYKSGMFSATTGTGKRKTCLPMQRVQLESLTAIPISAHMDILHLLLTILPFSQLFRIALLSLTNEQASHVRTFRVGIEIPYLVFLCSVCTGWTWYGLGSAFILTENRRGYWLHR